MNPVFHDFLRDVNCFCFHFCHYFSSCLPELKTPSVNWFSLILIHILQVTIRSCSCTWSLRRRAWLLQTPALSSTTVACTTRKSTLTSLVLAQIIHSLQMTWIAARHIQSTDLSFPFDAFCLDASHAWGVLTSVTGVNTDMTVPMTHVRAPSKRAESRSLRSVSVCGKNVILLEVNKSKDFFFFLLHSAPT